MRDKHCAVCEEPFNGEPAYLAKGGRWLHRSWHRALLLVCVGCWDARRGLGNNDHRKYPVYYWDMVGRGFNVMPPTPCVSCGQPVIRVDDPLLKRVTCSAACSTSLTRIRNGNQGSGQPCEICGTAITTGRADSRTCSPACRQKAYRRRQATGGTPAAPLLDARGRRMPQRSQLKSLQAGMAGLSGLCGAFARVDTMEGPVKAGELAHWRTELADAERIVESLHRQLRDRSGVTDSPIETPRPSLPTRRKHLASGTAALSGLCFGLARIKALTEDVTPELAAQWQVQAAEALAGIRNIRRVLGQDSHAQA